MAKQKNPYVSIVLNQKKPVFNYGVVNGPARIDLMNNLEVPTSPDLSRELATIFLGPINGERKRKGGIDFNEFDAYRFEMEENPFIGQYDEDDDNYYVVDGLVDYPIEAFSFSGFIGLYFFVLRVNVLTGALLLLTSLEVGNGKRKNEEFMHFKKVKSGDGMKVIAKFNEMIAERGQKHINKLLSETFAKVTM